MSRFELAAETRSSCCLRKLIVQSAVAAAMVSGLAACSAIPDSAKPGAVYGEATPAPTQPGTVGFPDLANVPDQKPKVTSSSDQKAIAESLAEDRSAARVGDKELKAGGVLPPPARDAEVKSPDEAMMQPDATGPAVEPTETATIAPAPAKPAPAKVEAPTPPAKEMPASAKQAETAPVAPPPPVMTEPAAEPAMTPEEGAAPMEPEASARPALQLPPGVIPMPERGGHKSLADILTPEQKAARKAAAAEEAKNAAEAGEPEEKAPESDEVKAAPTEPVEVQPVPDSQ